MNKNILNRFRQLLVKRRDTVAEWCETASENEKTRVYGYLALGNVDELVHEIEEAIESIDKGDFGKCQKCEDGGEVELERLELDFKTSVCLSHYSGEQLRMLENDLELAAKVQQNLLPSTLPALPGIQIAAHAEPAYIVGGDYFDFFTHHSGTQGVAIADVMGKGLPASMLVSNLQASLRILGPEKENLHAVALRLNELFRHNLKLIRFITIFLLAIDYREKQFRYCNAGHNPPLWWKMSSGAIRWLKPTGPAIGLTPEAEYKSESVRFDSGDILLMYTDGVVEARNSQREEFGEERLSIFTRENSHKPANDFLKDLREELARFTGRKFQDDVTLLVIKF
jgi:sigma-B regulation protein RsbU (phosphoserine phosphatase)